MRKISVLMATLIIVAMLLVACGAEETSTSGTTPSPEVPPVTADTTATDDGAGLTETVVPGTDTTTTPEIPVTGEDDASRITNQLGFTVWNQNGEQIGDVADMVLDWDNSRVAYVIVSTGGFLGLGDREIVVPWNMLDLQSGMGDATGGEQNAFVLQGEQEMFNNAPDFDLTSMLPEMGQPVDDWDAEIRSYWDSGVVPGTPEAGATVDPNMTATPEASQPEPTVEGAQGSGVTLQGVVLVSEILGTSVSLSAGAVEGQGQVTATPETAADQPTATTSADQGQATATTDPNQGSGQVEGDFSGTIDDMIVDVDSGDVRFLVVNTTLDDGERWIPVPLGFFQWDAANSALLLNMNSTTISDAPFFLDGQFPDTSVEGWSAEFDTFWDTIVIPS